MKVLNLNTDVGIEKRINLNETLKNLHKYDDLIVVEVLETEQLYPLDSDYSDRYKTFLKLHESLEEHKGQIFYLCSDLNIHERYKKWCDIVKPSKKFNMITSIFSCGFPVKNKIHQEINKKYNFCFLCLKPKIIRTMLIDCFFKNKKFIYSLAPFMDDKNVENPKTPIIPYQWDEKFESIKFVTIKNNNRLSYGYVYLHDEFECKNIFYPNGLLLNQNFKKLTEIKSEYDDLIKDPFKIDQVLYPLECYQSCCDIVIESYSTGDSVFFTEKTWKEISQKRPFIMLGAKLQNYFLKKIGFELYDDVFDYSFDDMQTDKRIETFINQIHQFLKLDVKEFDEILSEKNILEKIEYNNELLKSKLADNRNLRKITRCKSLELDTLNDKYANRLIDFYMKRQIYV